MYNENPPYETFSSLLPLLPLKFKYLSQHPNIEYTQFMFFPYCERPSFTLIFNKSQNYS
jgi:hypothetical protein